MDPGPYARMERWLPSARRALDRVCGGIWTVGASAGNSLEAGGPPLPSEDVIRTHLSRVGPCPASWLVPY